MNKLTKGLGIAALTASSYANACELVKPELINRQSFEGQASNYTLDDYDRFERLLAFTNENGVSHESSLSQGYFGFLPDNGYVHGIDGLAVRVRCPGGEEFNLPFGDKIILDGEELQYSGFSYGVDGGFRGMILSSQPNFVQEYRVPTFNEQGTFRDATFDLADAFTIHTITGFDADTDFELNKTVTIDEEFTLVNPGR